jgi:hypothetical protein
MPAGANPLPPRKKLIEVALPLEAINRESARAIPQEQVCFEITSVQGCHPLPSLRDARRHKDGLFLADIEDGDGISLNLEEDPEVGAGLKDMDVCDGIEAVRVFAYKGIAVPVSEMVEPGMDLTAAGCLKGP